MNKEQIKELVPLALIAIALIYTTIIVATTDIFLTLPHWLGYGFTLAVLITYSLNKTISTVILGVTIILGLTNVLAFTPTITTSGLRLGELNIKVQLFSLVVFLTFIYAHWKGFRRWINKEGL